MYSKSFFRRISMIIAVVFLVAFMLPSMAFAESAGPAASAISLIVSETTENTLDGSLEVTDDAGGITGVTLTLEDASQQQKTLTYTAADENGTLRTGTAPVSFVLDASYTPGAYILVGVALSTAGETTTYDKEQVEAWPFGDVSFTIEAPDANDAEDSGIEEEEPASATEVAVPEAEALAANELQLSSDDPQLIQKIQAMPDGYTAVIDASGETKIAAGVFSAVAGTNKTLCFNLNTQFAYIDSNAKLQVVFKGRDVVPSLCRDVNISIIFDEYPDGSAMGCRESKIYNIHLLDPKPMPGKVQVRVRYYGIFEKFIASPNGLVLSQRTLDEVRLRVLRRVACNADGFLELETTQGVNWFISQTEPKIENAISTQSMSDYAFVDSLYRLVLERKRGFNLQDGTEGFGWDIACEDATQRGSVAYAFIFSEEAVAKNRSDAEFVSMLYRTLLCRYVDDASNRAWLDMLAKGYSREYVCRAIVTSDEFLALSYNMAPGAPGWEEYCNNVANRIPVQPQDENIEITQFVMRLYNLCLERSADSTGINDWSGVLNDGAEGAKVAYGFFFSDEMQNRSLGNREYIEILYRVLMNRDPATDQAGVNDWLRAFDEGATAEQVFAGFVYSPEFNDICASYGIVRGHY